MKNIDKTVKKLKSLKCDYLVQRLENNLKTKILDKDARKEKLIKMMKDDEKSGIYKK